MSDIPETIPDGFAPYSRSRDFTPDTLPKQLSASHSTKAGIWGLLHVLEGEVLYRLDAPRSGEVRVGAGQKVVIEEGARHSVSFIQAGRFYIEFYKA